MGFNGTCSQSGDGFTFKGQSPDMDADMIDLFTAMKVSSPRCLIVFGNVFVYDLEPGYQRMIDYYVKMAKGHGLAAYSNPKHYGSMAWNPQDPFHAPYTHQHARAFAGLLLGDTTGLFLAIPTLSTAEALRQM